MAARTRQHSLSSLDLFAFLAMDRPGCSEIPVFTSTLFSLVPDLPSPSSSLENSPLPPDTPVHSNNGLPARKCYAVRAQYRFSNQDAKLWSPFIRSKRPIETSTPGLPSFAILGLTHLCCATFRRSPAIPIFVIGHIVYFSFEPPPPSSLSRLPHGSNRLYPSTGAFFPRYYHRDVLLSQFLLLDPHPSLLVIHLPGPLNRLTSRCTRSPDSKHLHYAHRSHVVHSESSLLSQVHPPRFRLFAVHQPAGISISFFKHSPQPTCRYFVDWKPAICLRCTIFDRHHLPFQPIKMRVSRHPLTLLSDSSPVSLPPSTERSFPADTNGTDSTLRHTTGFQMTQTARLSKPNGLPNSGGTERRTIFDSSSAASPRPFSGSRGSRAYPSQQILEMFAELVESGMESVSPTWANHYHRDRDPHHSPRSNWSNLS